MDFAKKFKSLPNSKLLEIARDVEGYNAEANAAAEKELMARGVELNHPIEAQSEEIDQAEIGKENTDSKLHSIFSEIISFPDQVRLLIARLFSKDEKLSSGDIIQLASLPLFYFAAKAIYLGYLNFKLFTTLGYSDLTLINVYDFIVPMIAPLLAAIFLWSIKNFGWVISIVYILSEFIVQSTLLCFKLEFSFEFGVENYFLQVSELFVMLFLFYLLIRPDISTRLKAYGRPYLFFTFIVVVHYIWSAYTYMSFIRPLGSGLY